MTFDYRSFSEHIKPLSCVMSVEKFADGSYGNIRLVTSDPELWARNAALLEGTEYAPDSMKEFVEGQLYEAYIPKNKNFEGICYRSAILGETLHTYVRPGNSPVWMYITAIPLVSDKENIGYCAIIQQFYNVPDYSLMTNISPDTAMQVLRISMKLRGNENFMAAVDDVIKDIRDMCDAGHCCILTTDFTRRKCAVLCEALSATTHLLSMKAYVNDDFFAIIDTWHGSLEGSSCVIIKDEKDWAYLEKTNPVWYNSMKPAGAESIVLFPLTYRDATLGYIWAINFDTAITSKIKEMLEVATYFLASELANYQLFSKLETMSSTDMLTGVFNRNAMNNRVDKFTSGADSGQSVGIIFADLNGLKQINDSYGHFAGDLLIKDAAALLQKHFSDCEIYRAGGDEFMVLLVGIGEAEMKQRADDLRADAIDPEGVCLAVGWSYDGTGHIHRAMSHADEEMYADKERFYEKYPERRH